MNNNFSKSYNMLKQKNKSTHTSIKKRKKIINKVINFNNSNLKGNNSNKISNYYYDSKTIFENLFKNKNNILIDEKKSKIEDLWKFFYLKLEKQIYLYHKNILIKKILKNRELFNPINLNIKRFKLQYNDYFNLHVKLYNLKNKYKIKKIKSDINFNKQKSKYLGSVKSNLINFTKNINYFYKNDKTILKNDMNKYLNNK